MHQVSPVEHDSRDRVVDGLRGWAIVLVVASHMWTLTPAQDVKLQPFFTLLRSGNYAVTIFLAVAGFLATRSMLRQIDRTGTLRFGVSFIRRWLRLSGQVYALALVVLVFSMVTTDSAPSPDDDTGTSVWRIVTYTWTNYLLAHPTSGRADLGHLWYLSAYLWGVLYLLVLAYACRRRRLLFIGLLAASLLVVLIYRHHIFQTAGQIPALLHPEARIDGLLWGALAASVLPWLGKLRPWAPRLAVGTAAVLVLMMWAAIPDAHYFSWGGALLGGVVAFFLICLTLGPAPASINALLGNRILVALGARSLGIYVWHYPVFWYVAHHSEDWSTTTRALVALAAAAAIIAAAEILVERPIQWLLDRPGWRHLDDGLAPAGRRLIDTALGGRRDGRSGQHSEAPSRHDSTPLG